MAFSATARTGDTAVESLRSNRALLIPLVSLLVAGPGAAWAQGAASAPPPTAPAPAAAAPGTAVAAPSTTAPPAAAAPQSPTEDLFARKCASCHTVGKGNRVGPDLKDSHKRRSRAWLIGFVKTPSAMLDSDADARNLLTQFNGVRMPDLGLADNDVAGLVDLLVRCSTEPCNLAGKFTPVTVATAADFERGRALFLGKTPLKNGAAPCLSCHTVRGSGSAVPGGTLSKDLTHAFARLGDEGLDSALASPAFKLMNKVFADHPLDAAEVFALRAFLYKANLGGEPAKEDTLSVGLFGGLGTAAVLIVLNAAWARRLRGVRRPLVRPREPRA